MSLHDSLKDGIDVRALEGGPARDRFVYHASKGPNVHPPVEGFALHVFGTHVAGVPKIAPVWVNASPKTPDEVAISEAFVECISQQSEIEDLQRAIDADLYVRGLEIAMDDTALVRCLERVGDLSRD